MPLASAAGNSRNPTSYLVSNSVDKVENLKAVATPCRYDKEIFSPLHLPTQHTTASLVGESE